MGRVSTTKLPCGCKHSEAEWLSECPEHKAENDALHARWGRETRFKTEQEIEPWE